MDSDANIHTLDTCKFNPKMKCLKAVCPAWTDEVCAFDIGDVLVRKGYEALAKMVMAWQGMNRSQKLEGIKQIINKIG